MEQCSCAREAVVGLTSGKPPLPHIVLALHQVDGRRLGLQLAHALAVGLGDQTRGDGHDGREGLVGGVGHGAPVQGVCMPDSGPGDMGMARVKTVCLVAAAAAAWEKPVVGLWRLGS